MRRILWIGCFFLLLNSLTAQNQKIDLTNYQPLMSNGDIPLDFRLLSEEKYKADIAKIDKNEQRFDRKTKDKFMLLSNYYTDEVLLSGRVLFNDPISDYVNNVAKELLEKNHADLLGQVRFYVAKTQSVNAFSTDQGIIIINLGLIAQLENEAQLAFVISHELVHYFKKHSLNLFLTNAKIEKGKYGGISRDIYLLDKNARNRETEEEADRLAFELFYKDSKYSLDAIESVFDVLQYSYLPFDDITFDSLFFNYPTLKISQKYFLDKVNEIKTDEKYDESKSTHPSTESRRKNMKSLYAGMDNSGRSYYIRTKAEFINIRDYARFEVIRYDMIDQNFADAIYNTYVVMKDYPNNKFLETVMAGALYSVSKYRNLDFSSEVFTNYNKIEGESQQVYYLIKKIDEKFLNILALKYCWNLYKKHPESDYLKQITDDLFKELIGNHKITMLDFSETLAVAPKQDSTKDQTGEGEKKSKYDRIKEKKGKEESESDYYTYRFAFVDELKDVQFREKFTYWVEENEKSEKNKYENLTATQQKRVDKQDKKEDRQFRRNGYALGVEKVVVVDPMYVKIDERKKEQYQFIDSERNLREFKESIKEMATEAGVKTAMLYPKDFKSQDLEAFNDFTTVNDWVQEKINQDDVKDMVLFESQYMKPLTEKYNTDYFMWTGLGTKRVSKDGIAGTVILATVLVYTIPYAVYLLVKPESYSEYFTVVFNVNTGKQEMFLYDEYQGKDAKDYTNWLIYNTFNQIKAKRRSK